MTTILDIKPLIREFIVENLDKSFDDNVYWLGERFKVPQSPYCVLSVTSERKDHRTSTHSGRFGFDSRDKIVTVYKFAVITISIYTEAIGGNYDTAKEFAYSQINHLEQLFESREYNKVYSIENVGAIRPLHEVTDGGYQYRFELDLTVGYNETVTREKAIGRGVEVTVAVDNCKNENIIGFTVTDDEDNDNKDSSCGCGCGT